MWAIARADAEGQDLALWHLVETLSDANNWKPLTLRLTKGKLSDYPPSDILGRICSPKLVEVLAPFSTAVLWLPVELIDDKQTYAYSFMHLIQYPDVLDEDRTVFANNRVAIPCISFEKAQSHPLICLHPLSNSVIVRADVKDAIVAAACKGLAFQKVRTSFSA
jgi:hypothetical protein